MKTKDILQETVIALSSNKVRSGLTMLGIVIGISSVIVMVALGQGAQASVQASIQSIGSNLLVVMPGAQRGPGAQINTGRGSSQSLKPEDANAIRQEVDSLQEVAPEISGRKQVTARGTNTNTQVVGTTPDYAQVRNVQIAEGTFITDQAESGASRVAVIGPNVRDDLFGADADPTGQTIRINQTDFTVIGLTQAKGAGFGGSQDDVVFIPLSAAQRYISGSDYLSDISVQVTDASLMTTAQQDITALLLERHHISDPQAADFNILNQSDIVATASSVTQTLTLLLGAVAAISLIVGGIGIMNMMLTAVTERTREIGLRKAIGARRRDISVQFLAEAIALTFTGGLTGILLGWGIATGLSSFGVVQASVSTTSVFLAFGVSAAIGIVFGYYPAQRAARLNPIEALRYE